MDVHGTCTHARLAGSGNLAMLQWARVNGCPWDERSWFCAALNNHLEILTWAYANGCVINSQTLKYSNLFGDDVMEWLRANTSLLQVEK